ncbi:hypothetical protein H4R24_001278 [Coemansia sp. RSA 988]|nr:hypothetical protein H4R24_001278 [Coemansia sp. RSA 988]
MHVVVLGASRNTGKAFVEQAIKKGIHITALVRTPENLPFTDKQKAKITVVKGDATVKEDLVKVIADADIVLSSLGAKVALSGSADAGVESKATPLLIEVIKENRASNPPRIIMISSTGVGTKADVPYALYPLYYVVLREPLKHKSIAEAAIKDSGLPYTIVKPSMLTNGQLTKTYRAKIGISGYTISRSDVAHFILVQCVVENKWLNASPVVTY